MNTVQSSVPGQEWRDRHVHYGAWHQPHPHYGRRMQYPPPAGRIPFSEFQGPGPRRPDVSSMAVIGVVLGMCGFSIFGLIFSLCGLADVRHGLRRGRGVAVTGVLLGSVGCVLWAGLILLGTGGYPR